MELSPQRRRTREAILDAAAAEWARCPTASVGRIAATAGVGRATVHRYFPGSAHLRAALISASWATLHQAIGAAALGAGPVLDAVDRIVAAMIHAGDRMLFLFATSEGVPSEKDAQIATMVDEDLIREIERGQHSGELDAGVPAAWIQRLIWSVVYTGLHAAAEGVLRQHEVDSVVRRTLRGAIAAR